MNITGFRSGSPQQKQSLLLTEARSLPCRPWASANWIRWACVFVSWTQLIWWCSQPASWCCKSLPLCTSWSFPWHLDPLPPLGHLILDYEAKITAPSTRLKKTHSYFETNHSTFYRKKKKYIYIPKPWNLGYFNSLISTKFTKEFWHQTRFSDPQFESCIMASHKSLYFARQSFPDSIDSDVAENTCRLPQASTTHVGTEIWGSHGASSQSMVTPFRRPHNLTGPDCEAIETDVFYWKC